MFLSSARVCLEIFWSSGASASKNTSGELFLSNYLMLTAIASNYSCSVYLLIYVVISKFVLTLPLLQYLSLIYSEF